MAGKNITITEALNLGYEKGKPHLQTVIFNRYMGSDNIKKWLKMYEYKYSNLRMNDKFVRARQMNPVIGAKFSKKKVEFGIELIYQTF